MSSSANTSKTGAPFLWVLGAFTIFAVLFAVVQTVTGKKEIADPRAEIRTENREEIVKQQNELLAKLGLKDANKKSVIFTKTAESLKAKAPAASTQVVPGSPTQLKQAAAAPAPAAPAAAPATPAPAAPAK